MSRRALITGITGQDGAYLAEWLLGCGYQVHGATRSLAPQHVASLGSLAARVQLHAYELSNDDSLRELVDQVRPHELYHLAGPSFIPECVADPVAAGELLGLAVVKLLEAIRQIDPAIRFMQAGSSEIFGDVDVVPQDEWTPLRPRNPYGAAKAFAHWMVQQFRERFGLFACNAILYNHESPRRDERFVTRKISRAVARIHHGVQKELRLGDLNARRDWGFAGDFIRAMYLMMRHAVPGDYVVATGEQHSVREFCELAFACVGRDYRDYVVADPELRRSVDPHRLCGDAGKARRELGWEPRCTFPQLVRDMVHADLERLADHASDE